jgi:hypothetical protein
MTTEELLKRTQIPPEYAHLWDTPPPENIDLLVRLGKWKAEVSRHLRDLASYLASAGRLSTEEQSLLVIHIAQYVGHDPWVSDDARSQAECTRLLCSPISE